MPVLTLDKIIFRNNDSYLKMYKGSELIAEVESTPAPNYLTLTALEAGSTVNFNREGVTSEYSTDNGSSWTSGDNVTVTLSNVGDKVMYRGVTSTTSFSGSTTAFTLTGQIKASGNVNSMINKNPDDTSLNSKDYAFKHYFSNQSALKDISELKLPATTLTNGCYRFMFRGCTGITTIPDNFLPATTLTDGCYSDMLSNCTSLTTVPANLLPATTLTDGCYSDMLSNCTSLTTIPANLLPATTLASSCYSSMFSGCIGLTTVPANLLPATGITAGSCYSSMFYGCTNLTTAPTLSATSLYSSTRCYQYMFYGCTNLNKVVIYAQSIPYSNCLNGWLTNVSSTGDFYNLGGASYSSGASGIPEGWTVHTHLLDYLTFTALQSGSTVKFNSNRAGVTSEYSTDGGNTWLSGNDVTVTLSHVGDKVMYRGVTSALSANPDTAFILRGQIKASGSIMSMINKNPDDTSLSGLKYAFASYFGYQNALKDISELKLPATTLSDSCYDRMFYECKSLTTIPANFLPATTLSNSCYRFMFGSCTSLTTVPANLLHTTTLAIYCYNSMFNSCTSLTSTPNLPATTLADFCYSGMFSSCWSLTSTPNLPATTLKQYCYSNMFQGCTRLTTVPTNLLPARTLGNNCYANMFQDCTGLTTAPNLPATTLKQNCYNSMFYGCTSLTSTPNLPATTLIKYCYQSMFYGCTNLNRVVTYAQNISASNCLRNWLANVSSTGDFYNLGGASYSSGASGIPTGWTRHTTL